MSHAGLMGVPRLYPAEDLSGALASTAVRTVRRTGCMGMTWVTVQSHAFQRRGWRFWICTHCYAPRPLHPREGWVRARPLGSNYYLSANAPHFEEGW